MFQEFLQPCDNALMAGENYDAQQLGSYIVSDSNPEGMQVALIGVKEDRASVKNNGSADAPDLVRSRLFPLSKMSGAVKIVDLGNIEKGATVRDTYVALSKVTNELIRMKIVPV